MGFALFARSVGNRLPVRRPLQELVLDVRPDTIGFGLLGVGGTDDVECSQGLVQVTVRDERPRAIESHFTAAREREHDIARGRSKGCTDWRVWRICTALRTDGFP